ncbi:MAG: AAC(3) family N-acetyltransferase [Chloroflexia bacterium]
MATGQAPSVTEGDIRAAIRALGLSQAVLCVHSSLRSFGWVEGGADTVIDALLAEGCTLLVPAFSADTYGVPPPPGPRPVRNAWDYDRFPGPTVGIGRIYTPASGAIERGLGAIPAAVIARPGRSRGNHPLNSFVALGPRATWLVAEQQPRRIYAPLEHLAEAGGSILLMGVGLTNMTFLHLAEQHAGRRSFVRWANDATGQPSPAEVGSCGEGFDNFAPMLAPLERRLTVGTSTWTAYPARETLLAAVAAIRANPALTHCADPRCQRCNDAIAGGPLDG